MGIAAGVPLLDLLVEGPGAAFILRLTVLVVAEAALLGCPPLLVVAADRLVGGPGLLERAAHPIAGLGSLLSLVVVHVHGQPGAGRLEEEVTAHRPLPYFLGLAQRFRELLPAEAEALVEAVIDRYADYILGVMDGIFSSKLDAPAKLRKYAALFEATLSEGKCDKACLFGMLGAELASLGSPSAARVRRFYRANEERLARVLEDGRNSGELRFQGDAKRVAAMFFALKLPPSVLIWKTVARFWLPSMSLKKNPMPPPIAAPNRSAPTAISGWPIASSCRPPE